MAWVTRNITVKRLNFIQSVGYSVNVWRLDFVHIILSVRSSFCKTLISLYFCNTFVIVFLSSRVSQKSFVVQLINVVNLTQSVVSFITLLIQFLFVLTSGIYWFSFDPFFVSLFLHESLDVHVTDGWKM